jgi:GMP synthase-like glutamine amidotransferase
MRVHVLQHVPFEGLGSILPWLEARQAVVTTTRFFESPVLPAAGEFDAVIALGGPMSVNEESEYPWLKDEKRFIAAAVQADKPVLGICLGAQLIASSLGVRVYPGPHKEIGWFPVYACKRQPGAFPFPQIADVLHWHGETFDLPPGAIHLAKSKGCLNQAFQIGRRTIGLQFHLETTPESANAIIENCRHELVPDRFVQNEEELRSASHHSYTVINQIMANILTFLMSS